MGTRPLLRNARHRTIITPVNPLRLKLIHISPSYLQFIVRLKLFLNGHRLLIGIQVQCSMQTHCFQKNIQFDNCRGQLGLQWMSASKTRANVYERTVATNDIFWFMSPANWMRKANMKRKYVNTDNAQWKEPELTTLIREVGAGIATADTCIKCFCTKTLPSKHVLVLIDLSTLGTPQFHSIWISTPQLKTKTRCDLNPQ